jgi:hypothetical protein
MQDGEARITLSERLTLQYCLRVTIYGKQSAVGIKAP